MKKLLILTPRYPYPVIGGDKLRIYELCRQLSKSYRLTLLSLCETQAECDAPAPNDGVFSDTIRVYLPRWRSMLNTLYALPKRLPLQIAYYSSTKFRTEIERLLPKHDGVLSHLIRTGHYVRNIKKPSLLEMTDAIGLNYQRANQLQGKQGLKQWIFKLESRRLDAYEKAVAQKFDLVTLVSSVDEEHLFGKTPPLNSLVCTNGINLDDFPYTPNRSGKTICFIGNMRTAQNLDACLYFSEEVLPLLNQQAEYQFRIIGSIPEKERPQFAKFSNVELTGRVDSISEAAQDAFCAVCPMRIGAGVQNKVLEYMALGLPTVSTTLGNEGLGSKPGKELLVADTPQAISEAIQELVANPSTTLEIAKNARSYVERNHDWAAMTAPFINRVNSIFEKQPSIKCQAS